MSEEASPSSDDGLDAFVAAVTAGAALLPESRVLDPLVGTFEVETAWEPIVGRSMRRSVGRCEGAWVYDGRMIDSRQFDDGGIEVARTTFAYDPTNHDYVAISLNVMSTFYEVERGHYDADVKALILEFDEPMAGAREPVRVRRTIEFVDQDCYTISITYPESPPEAFGPMHITYSRIG